MTSLTPETSHHVKLNSRLNNLSFVHDGFFVCATRNCNENRNSPYVINSDMLPTQSPADRTFAIDLEQSPIAHCVTLNANSFTQHPDLQKKQTTDNTNS